VEARYKAPALLATLESATVADSGPWTPTAFSRSGGRKKITKNVMIDCVQLLKYNIVHMHNMGQKFSVNVRIIVVDLIIIIFEMSKQCM
jgi:hypothetical protein